MLKTARYGSEKTNIHLAGEIKRKGFLCIIKL
jgi:hypothetical protein